MIPVGDITLGNLLELLQLVFYVSCHFYGTVFSLLEGFMLAIPDFLYEKADSRLQSFLLLDGPSSLTLQVMALHLP